MTQRASIVTAAAALLLAGPLSGCGGDAAETEEQKVARAMQRALEGDIATLHQAAIALQAAAPTPAGRGWDAGDDAAAIAAMKAAWIDARVAYEHVEGAIAPIFPELDVAIDQRYDGYLAVLGAQGDADLFDDQGVTGMHGIERVLYADGIPPRVVVFETSLPGYRPAAFPSSAEEAMRFKTLLAARFVSDAQSLVDGWMAARNIDVSGAFQGLIGLMNEQQEKVNNAASGEEESRYSQRTMSDLRANLDGTAAIYALFRPWLQSKPAAYGVADGTTVDQAVMAGFEALRATYAAVPGDAIPAPPATWSAENPSAADLETPFGMLFQTIRRAVDPLQADSIVHHMNDAAVLLRIPGFAG
jgi:iron uptake system component EfeO